MRFISWGYWLCAVLVVGVLAELHGRHSVQQKWNIENAVRTQQTQDALKQRQADNVTLAAQQTAIKNQIQKAHDEEINVVRHALANVERLRIGTHFCPDITGQTTTQSTTSSDGTDTTRRVLSEEMDRAVKQLILESEQAAATGRAAQAFIRDNGLAEE